jgi:Ca2+-binding EF-hand superfamily protein
MKILEKSTHFNQEQIINFYLSFMQDCPNGQLNKKDFNKMFTQLQPVMQNLDKGNKYCEYVFKLVFFLLLKFCF